MSSAPSSSLNMANSSRQFMVNFVTKSQQWAVPSSPFNILGSNGSKELNSLIKTLLTESGTSVNDDVQFEFLINCKLFRGSLQEFVENENLSVESQIEIEFLIKEKAPSPYNSLLHDDWIAGVDTKDNWIISGCYDNTVHIWNLAKDGQHMIAIPAHAAPVKDVKWIMYKVDDVKDPDDHLFISSSHDESAIVWKWNSKTNHVEYLYVFRGHSRSVDCIDVHNDLIATASYDQMLKIWSLSREKENDAQEPSTSKQKKLKTTDAEDENEDKNRVPILTLSGHTEAISGCVWIDDSNSSNDVVSNIATCSMDNTIRLWDIEIGETKQILKGSKAFMSISYSPLNHYLITGSCDRHIRLWDPRSNEGTMVKSAYTSHQSWVSSVQWSTVNENQFISGSYDNIVKQWDVRSINAPLYDLLGHDDKVLCVNWSCPQYMVSGSADNHLKIFESNVKK